MTFDPKTGSVVRRLNCTQLMVKLEQVHAEMMARMAPFPLGEIVLITHKIVADALGPAVQLNGRRVRVDTYPAWDSEEEHRLLEEGRILTAPLTDIYCMGVYLVREADYQANQGATE
ncbi:MAG TPA: hypothetical protein VM537_04505 [Anaerolineae bacterium]|nr:hypothetical protein [Anaerolineae bacterium]